MRGKGLKKTDVCPVACLLHLRSEQYYSVSRLRPLSLRSPDFNAEARLTRRRSHSHLPLMVMTLGLLVSYHCPGRSSQSVIDNDDDADSEGGLQGHRNAS